MSRVGNRTIIIPTGVTASVDGNTVTVKGPKGELSTVINENITVNINENEITFYYCPNLTKDNKCSIHVTRPDCCRRAPRNGWSIFPPGCGFKGWQFQQRERVKGLIRKIKEHIIELELLEPETIINEENINV